MTRLELVLVHDRITDPQPAVFDEAAAAKYIRLSRTKFRANLLFSGRIPYAEHIGGKKRIFYRSDLDDYLRGLNWRTMKPCEVSPVVLKGVTE